MAQGASLDMPTPKSVHKKQTHGLPPLRRSTVASTIDANVALRYLLWDDEAQAKQAKQWIIEGACMYMESVAEVVYVLQGVYKLSRAEIDTAVENLLDDVFVYDEEIMRAALRMYAMSSLDFVDCTLVARNVLQQEPVRTFDKQLARNLRDC